MSVYCNYSCQCIWTTDDLTAVKIRGYNFCVNITNGINFLKMAEKKANPLDINGPNFNPDLYLEKLFKVPNLKTTNNSPYFWFN